MLCKRCSIYHENRHINSAINILRLLESKSIGLWNSSANWLKFSKLSDQWRARRVICFAVSIHYSVMQSLQFTFQAAIKAKTMYEMDYERILLVIYPFCYVFATRFAGLEIFLEQNTNFSCRWIKRHCWTRCSLIKQSIQLFGKWWVMCSDLILCNDAIVRLLNFFKLMKSMTVL